MSHFSVLVITDPRDDVEETVTRLLAPYDEQGEWFREESHWDWWVIGGRWTGYLDPAYDPYTDPANYVHCKWCQGTGVTPQAVADEYPAYQHNVGKPCIQCATTSDGEPKPFPGKMLRWDLVPHPGDRGLPVKEVIERGVKPTFALVTPDGAWHQSGDMGWWGMVSNENTEWDDEWQTLVKANEANVATIVDCHV